MKKLILFFLTMVFILTGCSKEQTKNLSSLNGFLSYDLPKGWITTENYDGVTEISVEREDKTIAIMVEYIEYSYDKPEGFIEYQNNILTTEGATLKEEQTIEEKGRKIQYKNYKVPESLDSFIFTVGTIEIDENKDAFLGFMGTLVSEEIEMKEVLNFLNTVDFTNIKLNKPRKVSSENEYVEFTLSEGWRRFERIVEYSFYKSKEDGFLYSYTKTYNKNEVTPQEQFDNLNKGFEQNFSDAKIYLEDTLELEDKTIKSRVYEYDLGGLLVYTYINIIEFKDSDLFVSSTFDIAVENGFESVKEELNGILKSMELKKNAEKLYEKNNKNKKDTIEQTSVTTEQASETETNS